MPQRKLSEDEQRIRDLALKFNQEYGIESPEEPGIEEGDLEDVVPYGSTLSMATPIGSIKKVGKKAVTKSIDELRGIIPEEKLAKIADEIRLKGLASFRASDGTLIQVGDKGLAGQALKQIGKENIAKAEDAASSIDYKKLAEELPVPREAMKYRAPKVSGEAKDWLDKTGIDPTRKTALEYIKEAGKKTKNDQELLLRKLKKPTEE